MRDTNIHVKHKYACWEFDTADGSEDVGGMNNIARIRKARGLRQGDLADIVGVTQPHISRLESGDEGPPLSLFRSIAEALDVPLSALFSDTRSEAEQALIDAFKSLPEARREGWLEMARLAQAEARAADREADQTLHQKGKR